MSWEGAAIGLTGGLVTAGAERNAARSAAYAEARRLRFNAAVAERQAEDALLRGRQAEYLHRLGGEQLVGGQRAALAAQGVVLDEGSALEVQLDTQMLIEYDALTIRNNAARESWGFKMQAQDYRMGAKSARSSASGAGTSAMVQGLVNAYSLYRAGKNDEVRGSTDR